MTANTDSRPTPFSRSDYKTLGLAALGGALEIYDFIIFVFFALTLSQLFFPPEMPEWLRLLQSFGIFVTGYLARPLGGILMAHFADRLGRKKVFSLSILMMALPCLLIGIMPTYAQIGYFAPLLLLALRILQGAAVGGEVPSAWVFVAEHAPDRPSRLCLGLPAGRADLRLLDRRIDRDLPGAGVHPGGNPRLRLALSVPAGRRVWRDWRLAASLAQRNPGVHGHAGAARGGRSNCRCARSCVNIAWPCCRR